MKSSIGTEPNLQKGKPVFLNSLKKRCCRVAAAGIVGVALLAVLVAPSPASADAIYFKKEGENGIQSVAGTIIRETETVMEIQTPDGNVVVIPRSRVYQVVRGATQSQGMREVVDPMEIKADPSDSRLGVKGGLNFANMRIDPEAIQEDDSMQSFALGLWYQFPVNDRVTIQPEAYYSRKGDSESEGGFETSTSLGYIDVPVLARIGFMHSETLRPSLLVGPSLGLNVSAKSKFETSDSTIDVDVKDQIRPLDFGLVIGGGVDFPLGERMIGLELRYSLGLSNVAEDTANGDGRNDVLAILGSIGLQ